MWTNFIFILKNRFFREFCTLLLRRNNTYFEVLYKKVKKMLSIINYKILFQLKKIIWTIIILSLLWPKCARVHYKDVFIHDMYIVYIYSNQEFNIMGNTYYFFLEQTLIWNSYICFIVAFWNYWRNLFIHYIII